VALARARRSQEDDVLLGAHEVERAEVGDDLPAHRALVLEVELLEALARREARGPDAGLATMGLAGRHLALQTGARYSSWLQPSARARSPRRVVASSSEGALSARHR